MKNVAVILAGGSGVRFGGKQPKQFAKTAGKTIIEHTLEIFQNSKEIDEIAVVIHQDFVSNIEQLIKVNKFHKVKKILCGGKERSDSSLAAINAYTRESDPKKINFIFHDSVRPFINHSIIKKVTKALKQYNAVTVAIPATDTVIEVDENSMVQDVPSRDKLRCVQTPQGFKLKTIAEAYNKALQDLGFQATDDSGVVIKYLPDEPVFVIDGDETNIKITYERDLFLADKLFQLKKS